MSEDSKPQKTKKQAREERLAKALRDNLRRRKEPVEVRASDIKME